MYNNSHYTVYHIFRRIIYIPIYISYVSYYTHLYVSVIRVPIMKYCITQPSERDITYLMLRNQI